MAGGRAVARRGGSTGARALTLCGLILAGGACAAPGPEPDTLVRAGEAIYRDGRLPDGTPVRASREAGTTVEGQAAACVDCHRPSGLGTVEGTSVVPPVIGGYLFRTRQRIVEDLDTPHVQGYTPNREAYGEDTLARAIREGVASDGRVMGYLMPRYALDDGAMAGLIAYLKALTPGAVPGVSATTLDFATIVTPEADPTERAAVLAVLTHFFDTQRQVIAADTTPMRSARGIRYRVTRQWRLHVWELSGAPATWGAQLTERMRAEPVFAVISGIGGAHWQPVHRWCEAERVPCLWPNVRAPVVGGHDFYSVYFSRGVYLEGDLIADDLAQRAALSGRIVSLFEPGSAGEAGAEAFTRVMAARGRPALARPVPHGQRAAATARTLADLRAIDALVLWLPPAALAALPDPPAAGALYASGLLGGLEQAPVPAAWRERLLLTYPFDLPEGRRVRMNFPLGWFRIQGIPVTAEQVQVDTYLACQMLSEALGHMLDSFVRDYLLERLEMMVSRRIVSGYYHLGLGAGQRYASKGGYLVRFRAASGGALAPEGEWRVPPEG